MSVCADFIKRRYMKKVVTCVYCGEEYPQGTPTSGEHVKALTDHIKICKKHPMREAERQIELLRSALVGVVGADGKPELEQMEMALRLLDAPAKDKAATINAVHALLDTLPT